MEVIKLLGLLTLLAGLGVVLVVVGYQSTKLLVSDGLERFMGAERVAAEEALIDAQLHYHDHPLMRGLIPKIRVVEVQFAPARCATRRPVPSRNYLVILKGYTFFLIPVVTTSLCAN